MSHQPAAQNYYQQYRPEYHYARPPQSDQEGLQAVPYDSGLQAVQYDSGLQAVPYAEGLHAVPQPKFEHTYYAGPPVDPDSQHPSYNAQTPKATVCGLRRSTFWLLVAIAVLLIGAAVGGGVGGTLASKSSSSGSNSSSSSSSSSSTTTPTPTSSSSSSSSTTSSSTSSSTSAAATDVAGCPVVNEQTYVSSTGAKFKKLCNTDIIAINNVPLDIMKYSNVETFEKCIDNCAVYNTQGHAEPCVGIAYDLYAGAYQDCWLKNTTGVLATKVAPNLVVAALAIP